MNTHALLASAAFAVAALIGNAQADTPNVTAQPYHYGMPIDVVKVIAIEEPHPADCEIVKAKLTYLNSAGVVQAITYAKLDQACEEQN
ncbi:DUF2790 domain-containing protein [Pseudomonas sp. XS1P51]